jgi:hypothetical protein
MFAPVQALIVRFMQRVSAQTHSWLDLNETLGVADGYLPAREFVLFHDRDDTCDRAVALIGPDRECVMSKERTSGAPIHDGYLTLLELTLGNRRASDGGAGQVVREFLERERRRHAEPLMLACYGRPPAKELADHEVFRFMDYPAFDNGNGTIGFGLMVISSNVRYVWSRIAFAHK